MCERDLTFKFELKVLLCTKSSSMYNKVGGWVGGIIPPCKLVRCYTILLFPKIEIDLHYCV